MRPMRRPDLLGRWLSILLGAAGLAFLWRVLVDHRGLLSAMAAAVLLLAAVVLELVRPPRMGRSGR